MTGKSDKRYILSNTESICPECLTRIPAQRVLVGTDVFLEKQCSKHGRFSVILWRGKPDFDTWIRPKTPARLKRYFTDVENGCPFDCGLCPEHRQRTCTALLEVTGRCNMECCFCFADSGTHAKGDPDLAVIDMWYRRVMAANGPCNIQISGGEPSLRADLAAVIATGKSMGFSFIQLNTNGLRISEERDYAKDLKDAGLTSVFLQFDGTEDNIYVRLRGRPLLEKKHQAIVRCVENGIGVVLVPTIVPGVNDHNIGEIIKFALTLSPGIRGVHFQPVSYFGRYPNFPASDHRITLPEIMTAIEAQTGGLMMVEHFRPPGCENALCSFHGNFICLPGKKPLPLGKDFSNNCCTPSEEAERGALKAIAVVARQWSAPKERNRKYRHGSKVLGESFDDFDEFVRIASTHEFSVSGMAFQDAWTMDLDRLKDCCIHTVSQDGRLIPFCAHNLTSVKGASLYR